MCFLRAFFVFSLRFLHAHWFNLSMHIQCTKPSHICIFSLFLSGENEARPDYIFGEYHSNVSKLNAICWFRIWKDAIVYFWIISTKEGRIIEIIWPFWLCLTLTCHTLKKPINEDQTQTDLFTSIQDCRKSTVYLSGDVSVQIKEVMWRENKSRACEAKIMALFIPVGVSTVNIWIG